MVAARPVRMGGDYIHAGRRLALGRFSCWVRGVLLDSGLQVGHEPDAPLSQTIYDSVAP